MQRGSEAAATDGYHLGHTVGGQKFNRMVNGTLGRSNRPRQVANAETLRHSARGRISMLSGLRTGVKYSLISTTYILHIEYEISLFSRNIQVYWVTSRRIKQ